MTAPLLSLPRRFAGMLLDEWSRGLARLVPGPRPPGHLLVQTDDTFSYYRRRGRGLKIIARGPLAEILARLPRRRKPLPVDLRLDRSTLLERAVELPRASRAHLATLNPLQIDRLTPWTEDLCRFAYRVDGGSGDTITDRLIAAGRRKLDPLLAELRQARVAAASIGSAEQPLTGRPDPDLAPRSDKAARLRPFVAAAALFLLLAGVGAIGLSTAALMAEQEKLVAAETMLASARAEANAARSATVASGPAEILYRMKAAAVPKVVVLDRLSLTVPDGTHLDALVIDGTRLQLSGASTDANALIALMERTPFFAGAEFAAPVRREEGGALERFDLLAEIAGESR
jgi:general secretion pathway protein L